MRSVSNRLSVIGISLLLGAFFTGLYSVNGLPARWGWADRLGAWGWMMTGPVYLATLGGGPVPDVVAGAACLGWAAVPALLAHPIRPNLFTACLTALGAFFWFASGIITMIRCVWGA
jgi:hypothetical protein